MTGRELKAARAAIGKLWELGRPLGKGELSRILSVSPQTVANYEDGITSIPGAVSLVMHWMQQGQLPPGGRSARRPAA